MATHVSFAPNRELPFVFGDLFQISSKLSHYRLGGIQQIASVISGQYIEKKEIHEETQQSEWFEEKEQLSERESSIMESTHEGMQQAVAETVAKSQKFGGSVEAEATYGVVRAAVSLSYDNDQSKSQSKTNATEFAHDVVTQSRELMRERTLSSRRQSMSVLDRTENVRGFDNRGGASSAFISRYVEEVHEFSLVQHEAHLFATFFAPFPAANYLNALEAGATNTKVGGDDPAKLSYIDSVTKKTVTVTPDQISLVETSPKFWFKLASIVGLVEPTPPPVAMGEAQTFSFDKDQVDENEYAHATATVKIPEGYRCKRVFVRSWAETYHKGVVEEDIYRFFVGIVAGKHDAVAKGWGSTNWLTTGPLDMSFDEEFPSGELPFTFYARGFRYGVFSTYFEFLPTETYLRQWKLRFFEELRNAKAGKGPADEILSSVLTVQVADLRSSPTAAEAMIKDQMELVALSFVTGTDFLHFDGVDRKKKAFPYYPAMDIDKINDLQPIYSFLHHGFDFAKMSYSFLPSRFGDLDQRRSAFAGGPTGMMTLFLNAGAAEIVLPVKTGFEEQLFFFQWTGIVFDGSDVPLPDDPVVLALYDEILEARALNQSPESITIDRWPVVMPTPHILLQNGATLPDFRPDAPPDPGAVTGNELSPKPA